MRTIRALVVDDEEPARELLRALLAKWPTVSIIGEAGDGLTALTSAEQLKPDLIFLDVQMPGLSGLDVASALAGPDAPMIVFVTAYDQYAVKAFELSACDYLLKPFDASRLEATMQRVTGSQHTNNLNELLKQLAPRNQRVVIKAEGRHIFLDPASIEWIEAVGKEARVHVVGAKPLVAKESMTSLEARLDPATFVRIHRSAIINRAHIREVQPWFKGDYVVIMAQGTRVTSGRTYRERVSELLSR